MNIVPPHSAYCLGALVNLLVPKMKIGKFANSVDLDEVAHYEPPHLDLHCFSSSL